MRGASALVRRAQARPNLRLAAAALPHNSASANTTPSTNYVCRQCVRSIQISQSPTTETPGFGGGTVGGNVDAFSSPADAASDVADARFEVLGTPYSLLSVSLAASQKLYTRRGTLVSVSGKAQNAQSTLSLLSPLTRAPLGVPFLYQRITSTSPITALISTRSANTTFTVLRLDGRTDWIVAQRAALLAWTGHTLAATPRIQRQLSPAHWGSTELTGRGLAALSARGHIYQLALAEGEELVLHPSSVLAYSITRHPPEPFRFRSTSLALQVPEAVTAWLDGLQFLRDARRTAAWKFVARLLFNLRTAARRTIWGDRLFLQFRGPTTILMSSRPSSRFPGRDVLSDEQVNEIADAPAGSVEAAVERAASASASPAAGAKTADAADVKVGAAGASAGEDGKVKFEDGKNLKEFEK